MACAIGICSSLQSQTDTSFSGAKQSKSAAKARPGVVKKLDGTKLFGFVEITDDYTIRITNESGIARLPIAQLSEADFQKYGFRKNRSQDGRFWYERKEALKTSEENPKSTKQCHVRAKVCCGNPRGRNHGISTLHRGLRKDPCFQERREVDGDK